MLGIVLLGLGLVTEDGWRVWLDVGAVDLDWSCVTWCWRICQSWSECWFGWEMSGVAVGGAGAGDGEGTGARMELGLLTVDGG